ncbi:transcriptional regulator family: Zinc finger, CCHC-type [Paecilomyces variotii]|nr:transcriptional regulator family: Zinc finger, CCHC-type [Paecilomyces variotii]KAJ9387518.1 transcriptional regulator family: Zinc finger, CCHC-type [Paecilomyces variotii]
MAGDWAPDGGWDDGDAALKETSYGNNNLDADFAADPAAGPAAGGKENWDPMTPNADGPAKDGSCRNCGQEGHFVRDCPEPRKMGACFNCGEEGHSKAECTKPRVFKGTCRICNQEGHPASECPEKPADICKNCKKEGHLAKDCTEHRKFDLNDIPDKTPEEAWAVLKKASDEQDLEDFREGMKIYSKAVPQATFADIEKKMREEDFKVFLIALEKEVGDCRSLINLQGKLDCKYVVGFYFRPKPQRANLKDRWPSNPEENIERLADAGLPYDRQIPKCSNCGEMGHGSKACKQERNTIERVEVKCVNCGNVGHRARDCTEKRRDRFACRNCGSTEHKASECTEPRSAEGVECKKCNEVGHFAKDCPQGGGARTCRNCGSEDHMARDCDKPRDVSTVTCRNCDQVGHYSRDCTEKKNWDKVKCNNCGEMGHTSKRCQKPAAETDEYAGFGGGDPDVPLGEDAGGFGEENTDNAGNAGNGGGWAASAGEW